uniref:Uncharacterized protein n=1 Tax=Poecilia latipinna TaxID=48699 RepID=A0A3B3U327_9TELE
WCVSLRVVPSTRVVGCSAEQFTFGKIYVFPFRHKAEMCPFIDSYDNGLKPHRETHASNHFTCKVHRLPLSDHNRAIKLLKETAQKPQKKTQA